MGSIRKTKWGQCANVRNQFHSMTDKLGVFVFRRLWRHVTQWERQWDLLRDVRVQCRLLCARDVRSAWAVSPGSAWRWEGLILSVDLHSVNTDRLVPLQSALSGMSNTFWRFVSCNISLFVYLSVSLSACLPDRPSVCLNAGFAENLHAVWTAFILSLLCVLLLCLPNYLSVCLSVVET